MEQRTQNYEMIIEEIQGLQQSKNRTTIHGSFTNYSSKSEDKDKQHNSVVSLLSFNKENVMNNDPNQVAFSSEELNAIFDKISEKFEQQMVSTPWKSLQFDPAIEQNLKELLFPN